MPGRVAHAYRNVGRSNGRLLAFFRDSARMQPFFEEVGERVADAATCTPSGPPDLQRVVAIAGRHGLELAGPPPAA